MSATGRFFVTPHAVVRFRRRIADLPYDLALAAIIKGLQHPVAMRRTTRRDGRPVYDLAVQGKYSFIATVVPHDSEHLLPAVVTIHYASRGIDRSRGRFTWERSTWTKL
jgi:hypothetical protein